MRRVSSRELKSKLAEVLRQVRENQEEFVVTDRGRPIARIVPEAPPPAGSTDFEALWAEMDRVAAEIGRQWPVGVSAAQAVADDRREI
jgi:prevent-host-death family protein